MRTDERWKNITDRTTRPATVLTEAQIQRIQDAVKDIRYGAVSLIIQGGRLIQIDRSEKIRLKAE